MTLRLFWVASSMISLIRSTLFDAVPLVIAARRMPMKLPASTCSS